MKTALLLVMLAALSVTVLAHGEEAFAQAEELIEQKVPCDELNDDQLEMIGDYYMEQMHPGEQHERMDAMMGGEGSERLDQMHINMALSFYCGQHEQMQGQPMHMMMGQPVQQRQNVLPWLIAAAAVIAAGIVIYVARK